MKRANCHRWAHLLKPAGPAGLKRIRSTLSTLPVFPDRDQDGGQDQGRQSQSPSARQNNKGCRRCGLPANLPQSHYRRPCPATRLRGSPLPGRPKAVQARGRGASQTKANLHPLHTSRLHLHDPPPPPSSSSPSRSGVSARLAHTSLGKACQPASQPRACPVRSSLSRWSTLPTSQSASPPARCTGCRDWRRAVTAPPSPAFHSLPSSRIQPTSNSAQGFILSHSLSLPPATLLSYFSYFSASPPLLPVLFTSTLKNPPLHPSPIRTLPPSTPGIILRGRRGIYLRWLE